MRVDIKAVKSFDDYSVGFEAGADFVCYQLEQYAASMGKFLTKDAADVVELVKKFNEIAAKK